MLLAVALTMAAAKSAPPKAAPVAAKPNTISAIDLQNLTFKVMGDDGKTETMYNVTTFTEVCVNGKAAKFEDMKKGMKIKVTSSDGKNAGRVDAEGGLPPITPTTKKKK